MEVSIALSAASHPGMRSRATLAVIPTSVHTTVRQHASDILGELQSPDIPSQQSMSDLVGASSGIKQATCGASPQARTTAKTNPRNDHDMCRVYIGVPRMKVSPEALVPPAGGQSTLGRCFQQSIDFKHLVELIVPGQVRIVFEPHVQEIVKRVIVRELLLQVQDRQRE